MFVVGFVFLFLSSSFPQSFPLGPSLHFSLLHSLVFSVCSFRAEGRGDHLYCATVSATALSNPAPPPKSPSCSHWQGLLHSLTSSVSFIPQSRPVSGEEATSVFSLQPFLSFWSNKWMSGGCCKDLLESSLKIPRKPA